MVTAFCSPGGGIRTKSITNRSSEISIHEWLVKRKCLIDPGGGGGYCLGLALEFGRRRIIQCGANEQKFRKLVEKFRSRKIFRQTIKNKAVQLFERCNILPGKQVGIDELNRICKIFPFSQYSIKVFNSSYQCIFHHNKNETSSEINLLLVHNHYYYIKNLKTLLGGKIFCNLCENAFTNPVHKCLFSRCTFCKNAKCQNVEKVQSENYCASCNIVWNSPKCYATHLQSCGLFRRCLKCNKVSKGLDPKTLCHKTWFVFF